MFKICSFDPDLTQWVYGKSQFQRLLKSTHFNCLHVTLWGCVESFICAFSPHHSAGWASLFAQASVWGHASSVIYIPSHRFYRPLVLVSSTLWLSADLGLSCWGSGLCTLVSRRTLIKRSPESFEWKRKCGHFTGLVSLMRIFLIDLWLWFSGQHCPWWP